MKFTLNRNKVVSTLFGHSIEFIKDVPVHVPPTCYEAVIAVGAIPEEDLPDEEETNAAAPQGAEREAAIKKAIEEIVLKNQREDFTAAGAPHHKVLTAKLGFTVSAKERDEAWTKAQQADE